MFINSGFEECHLRFSREEIQLKDGEVNSVDWTPRNYRQLDSKTPIIVVVGGLTTDSRASYVRTFCDYAAERGYRTCIYNRRGHGRMKFSKQVPDPVSWNKLEDMDQTLEQVHKQFPEAPLFLAGMSMGANYIQLYTGTKGRDGIPTPIAAIGCISSPYCLFKAIENIKDNYLIRKTILSDLRRLVKEHMHEPNFKEALA